MKLTKNLSLEMVPYIKDENNAFVNHTSTYEDAHNVAGKENAAIGYVITNTITGIIPDEYEDMYPTAEAAIKAVFSN